MTQKDKIAQLEADIAAEKKEKEALKNENTFLKSGLVETEKHLLANQKRVGELETENKALKDVVEPMAEELEALKSRPGASKIPTGTFKHNGTEYGFRFASAILPRKGNITAEEILKDKGLQAELVKIGSGMIKKTEKTKK